MMVDINQPVNGRLFPNQSINGVPEPYNNDALNNEHLNTHFELFSGGLDVICNELKAYLDSLTVSNSIYNLHPSFNRNLSQLFSKSDNLKNLSEQDLNNYQSKSDDSTNGIPLNQGGSYLGDPEVSSLDGKHVISGNINGQISFYNSLSVLCNNKRFQLENDVINTLLNHEKELSEFSIDLNHSNSTLELIEKSLSDQYKSLEISCNNIKKLHEESKDLSFGLENRKKLVERLQEFVKDVIITPTMIKSLCGDAINEDYVTLVEEFSKKVNRINTNYKQKEYPALEFTKIQVKKLELVLIRRIFDFLSMEISNLAVPKVNIQLLQTTRFSTYYPLYKYLNNFTNYTNDLKKLYVYTMKRTYSHLFENYLNSLESCFEKERCRDTTYILKVRSAEVVKRLNKTVSYYDLNGRDGILEDFNSQPMLPTGLKGALLKKELIVKSYFKLLVDTCATEFSFLGSFFGGGNDGIVRRNSARDGDNKSTGDGGDDGVTNGTTRSDVVNDNSNEEAGTDGTSDSVSYDAQSGSNTNSAGVVNTTDTRADTTATASTGTRTIDAPNANKPERTMLKEIFSEVFEIISFNLKNYYRTSFDLVALGLIYSVIRFNRRFLLYKHITFFESEMYELETLAYDRCNFILKEVHNLIVKVTRNPPITTIFSWNPAPFVVNSSHILMIIIRINEYTNKLNSNLIQLSETLNDIINKCSNRLDPNKSAVFLINNLAPLVDALETASDKAVYATSTFDFESFSKRMRETLDSSLSFYSNYLLTEFISELINVMSRKDEEDVEVDFTPKKTLALATEALEYRTICTEFIDNYSERIILIKNLISQSFVYPPTTTLVNTHVFDMFYDVYNKFYTVIMEMFKESPSEWLSKMPNPSEFKQ